MLMLVTHGSLALLLRFSLLLPHVLHFTFAEADPRQDGSAVNLGER